MTSYSAANAAVDLSAPASPFARAAVAAGASLLVLASAGMGMHYAFTSSIGHGLTLAALAVAMALGLELCKPFAVEAIGAALSRRQFGQALALLPLAVVAVLFSLVGALSLLGTVRSDAAADRAAINSVASQRERMEAELSSLPSSRLAGALEAEIQSALLEAKLTDCQRARTAAQRDVCQTRVGPLLVELANSKRRSELEAALAAGKITPHRQADPAASAVAAYVGAIGWVVRPETVSSWLLLVPIIALEIGSMLAVVLWRALGAPPLPVPAVQPPSEPIQPLVGLLAAPRGRTAAERAVLDRLEAGGGELNASLRELARQTGCSRSTLGVAVTSLAASGMVARTANGGLRLLA